MSKWVELDDTNLKNIGCKYPIAKRVYGLDGKPWPRLVIYIVRRVMMRELDLSAIRIGVYVKDRGKPWEEYVFPRYLLPDLIDMLKEVVKR